MSVWSRSLVVLTAGAVVLVSGCGVGGSSEDGASTRTAEPASSKALEEVDACQILQPQQLSKVGLQGPGQPYEALPWAPGCEYDGEQIGLSVYTNYRQTVSSAEKKPGKWATFTKTDIGGRAAATAISKGSTEARICNVLFNAGGGLVRVQVGDSLGKVDECAKAQEIATMIEPRMPEPA